MQVIKHRKILIGAKFLIVSLDYFTTIPLYYFVQNILFGFLDNLIFVYTEPYRVSSDTHTGHPEQEYQDSSMPKTSFNIRDRICVNDFTGTVRYKGPIEGTRGE